MRAFSIAACLAALIVATGPAGAEDMQVDLELVLAVDASRSMDAQEQRIQREGYIAAIQHPDVMAAIRSGLNGRIALTYMEWAGPASQQIIVPWKLIDGQAAADEFVEQIEPGLVTGRFSTSISSSLLYAATLFEGNGYAGHRRIIDVSGDGPNNGGPPVVPSRDRVLAQGITINGLPIMLLRSYDQYGVSDLDTYYKDCVVGGQGAFTLSITETDQFETAIRRKLIQEIAGGEPRIIAAADGGDRARSGGVTDCLIGEKRRGLRYPSP
jgi:hypothetical protein